METLDGVVCFNAPIQPGDSGGPLLKADGRVIGMDTAGALSTATGASANWGCAIPITRATTIAKQIESRNGVAVYRIRPSRHSRCGRHHQGGRWRLRRDRGTPGDAAAIAGLVAGDVITAVGGVPVPSMADLNVVMQDRRPGDEVDLVWRDAAGQAHTAVAVLSAGPPA